MSRTEIANVVAAVLKAQESKSGRTNHNLKLIATALGLVVTLGAVYTFFFEPHTLAQAAEATDADIEGHEERVHAREDARMSRIEGKLDRLIERE